MWLEQPILFIAQFRRHMLKYYTLLTESALVLHALPEITMYLPLLNEGFSIYVILKFEAPLVRRI